MLEATIPCFFFSFSQKFKFSYFSLLFRFSFVNKSEIWDRPTPLWPKRGKARRKSPNCIDVIFFEDAAELTGTIGGLLQGCICALPSGYILPSSTYN